MRAPGDHEPVGLPREIWWEVMKIFGDIEDHNSLFVCAQVNRTFAALALPILYGISEHSNASASAAGSEVATETLKASVALWRSIITSAIGQSSFPYCTWIKTLKLSDLLCLLEDIGRDQAMRARFFSPPLQQFEILNARRRQGLDFDEIIGTVAEKVIDRIQASADEEDKVAGLLNLEGPHLPSARLSTWLRKLPMLKSLSVRDGSVLTAAVGEVIKDCCPAFKELTCYYCRGTDVDENMAAFFSALKPNTLESFTVNSLNDLWDLSFTALGSHAQSLKNLELQSLNLTGFESLHLIGPCPLLTELVLEGDPAAYTTSVWRNLEEAVSWITKCPSLNSFSSLRVPLGHTFLQKALEPDTFRLKHLHFKGAADQDLFLELSRHKHPIENLSIHIMGSVTLDEEAIETERHTALFNWLVTIVRNLKHLVLDEPILEEEFAILATGLNKNLETLVINPYQCRDAYFQLISSLLKLKTLTITSVTDISFEQMVDFLDRLHYDRSDENYEKVPPPDHQGILITLANQEWRAGYTEEETEELQERLKKEWGGTLVVNYTGEPDELHEFDFSD